MDSFGVTFRANKYNTNNNNIDIWPNAGKEQMLHESSDKKASQHGFMLQNKESYIWDDKTGGIV